MKQLITLIAVLLIILPFPLQDLNQNRMAAEQAAMQKIVHNAKEKAKQEGYFSDANKSALAEALAKRFKDVKKEEITIDATSMRERKQRGELIHYKVSVPIKEVVAAAKFYGIDPRDNQTVYIIENYTTSEWLP